jgi:WD40 repeat protein
MAVISSQLSEPDTLTALLAGASNAIPDSPAKSRPGLARFRARQTPARLSRLPSGLEPDTAAELASAIAAALHETALPVTAATFRPENIRLKPDRTGWQVFLDSPPETDDNPALAGKTSLAAFAGMLYRVVMGQDFAPDRSRQKEQLARLQQENSHLAAVLEDALSGRFNSPGALAGAFGWSLYRQSHLNFPPVVVSAKGTLLKRFERAKPAPAARQLPDETPANARTWGGPLALGSLVVALLLLAGTIAVSVTSLERNYSQESLAPTPTLAPPVAPSPTPVVAQQISRQPDGSTLTRYNPAFDRGTAQYIDPASLAAGNVAVSGDFRSLQVQNARWSANGKQVSLALKDGGYETWDVTAKQRLSRKELPNPEQYLAVSWSPDGQNFAAMGLDGQLKLGKAGRVLRTVAVNNRNTGTARPAEFSTYPWPFSWSPDSANLLVAAANNNLQVWNFQNLPTQIVPPQNSQVPVMNMRGNALEGSIVWSGDSRYLARLVPGTLSQQIEIYNPRNLARLFIMEVRDTPAGLSSSQNGQSTGLNTVGSPGLAWSPDGRYMAIIRTFNLEATGTAKNFISTQEGALVTLLELPDLNTARSTGTGRQATEGPPGTQGPTRRGGNNSPPLRPVQVETLTLAGMNDLNTGGDRNLAWSGNNRLLVMGNNSLAGNTGQPISYRAMTLDLQAGSGRWHWQTGEAFDLPFQEPANFVGWLPDNRQVLFNTTGNLLGTATLPEQAGQAVNSEILYQANGSDYFNYLPSPDGRTFLQTRITNGRPALAIKENATGQTLAELAVPSGQFSFPGKAVWAADGRALVMPFNVQKNVTGGTPEIESIIRTWRFEPDKPPALLGDLIIPSSDNNILDYMNNLAWDGKDESLAVLFEFETNKVGRWQLSQPLPSLAEQRQIIEKNTARTASQASDWPYFQVTGQIAGNTDSRVGGDGIWTWLPDHKRLVYCTSGNCYIQEILAPEVKSDTKQDPGIRFDPPPLTGTGNQANRGITNLAASPDGLMVAVALPNGLLNLYDAATGKLFNSFTAHQGQLSSLAFSADGRYLSTSGIDRAVKVWDTTTWRPQAVLRLTTPTANSRTIQWLPDNKTLVVGSYYSTGMLLWRALG